MIYNLIKLNMFDILEKIYAQVVNKKINDAINKRIDALTINGHTGELYNLIYGLVDTRFKGEKTSQTIKQMIENYVTSTKALLEMSTLEYIKQNKENFKKIDKTNLAQINKILKSILRYDYLMTPLEGIYINENIIGLIKFLSKKLVKGSDKSKIDVLNEDKVKQKKMVLDDQRNIARTWLISSGEMFMRSCRNANASDCKNFPDTFPVAPEKAITNEKTNLYFMVKELYKFEEAYKLGYFPNDKHTYFNNVFSGVYEQTLDKHDIQLNFAQLVKQQSNLLLSYASNKIYNFEKPIITDILMPYIESDDKTDAQNKVAIKDYKMFYLFGNYDDNQRTQFKCEYQIKLLNNTENFIQAISS